ncbi:hypothetical protein AALC25_07725 [Lachnospiraceae bacterium 29-84]
MKQLELKKLFQNKVTIRVVAGVITIAVLGTSVGIGTHVVQAERSGVEAVGEENGRDGEKSQESGARGARETVKQGDGSDTQETGSEDAADTKADTQRALEKAVGAEDMAEDAGKEETVYVVAHPDGAAKQVIVSEWLKNESGEDKLEDVSDLNEIQNVKGDEAFERKGDKITWSAGGNDIYYQGTTERELPVTEKVTYYLDGKEIKAEELAGKSGKVTIRFDYENHEKVVQDIDGKKHEVYVPFTVVTGMALPESFQNVKVTNGKVISDGNKKMVVGFAMPGLKESLDITEGKLQEKGIGKELEIPEYLEVTADVEGFSLDMTMSVVVNDLLSEAKLGEAFDMGGLEEDMDDMEDASGQLVEGSTELSKGLGTLKGSMKEFSQGVDTLKDGIVKYTDGAGQLNQGIGSLAGASGTLIDGVAALDGSAAALNRGVANLDQTLKAGMTKQEKDSVAGQANAAVDQAFQDKKSGSEAIKNQAASVFYDKLANDKKAKAQVGEGLNAYTEQTLRSVLGTAFQSVALDTAKKDKMAEYRPKVVQAVTQQVVQAVTQQATAGVTAAAIQEQLTQMAAALQENGAALDAETIAQVCAAVNAAVNTEGSPARQQIEALIAQQDINGLVASNVEGQMAAIEAQVDGALASAEGQAQIQATVDGLVNQTVATALASDALKAGVKNTAAQIVEGIANGAKESVGTAVADTAKTAAKSAAESAALTAVSGTKSQISEAINAADASSGYSLVSGMQALSEGTHTMSGSMPSLTAGIAQLRDGAASLASNSGALTSGAGKLQDATGQVAEGVDELEDGSKQLMDGMVQFDEEGIQKLVDAYNGDVKELLDRLEAVEQAGKEYQTFTKVADGTSGSVKFIYRTEGIEAEEE